MVERGSPPWQGSCQLARARGDGWPWGQKKPRALALLAIGWLVEPIRKPHRVGEGLVFAFPSMPRLVSSRIGSSCLPEGLRRWGYQRQRRGALQPTGKRRMQLFITSRPQAARPQGERGWSLIRARSPGRLGEEFSSTITFPADLCRSGSPPYDTSRRALPQREKARAGASCPLCAHEA